MDGSLLFSVSYSEDGDISTFNLESELEGKKHLFPVFIHIAKNFFLSCCCFLGYDELYSLLHRYILSDDDIRFLLKRNDLSVDVTKVRF